MSQITTHVLDTSKGKPAAGVKVTLYSQHTGDWKELARGSTNEDGRITDLLKKEVSLEPGVYKMRFETQAYYEKHHTAGFYPYVDIVFNITAGGHYHVPLLLNPFGYSTYRGS